MSQDAELKLMEQADRELKRKLDELGAFLRQEPYCATTLPSELTPDARRLLHQIKGKVSVAILTQHYPRLLNEIGRAWQNPDALRRCLESLMLDERGTRSGFPQRVLNELSALRHHYFSRVSPERIDIWERTLLR